MCVHYTFFLCGIVFFLLDYSCALQRDILIHGRLFVTQNWLCFYANIFTWETLVSMLFACSVLYMAVLINYVCFSFCYGLNKNNLLYLYLYVVYSFTLSFPPHAHAHTHTNAHALSFQLTIPFVGVTAITKERTAYVFPNAVQITTSSEKYGFSSLISRDITYNVLFKVWQNSLLNEVMATHIHTCVPHVLYTYMYTHYFTPVCCRTIT